MEERRGLEIKIFSKLLFTFYKNMHSGAWKLDWQQQNWRKWWVMIRILGDKLPANPRRPPPMSECIIGRCARVNCGENWEGGGMFPEAKNRENCGENLEDAIVEGPDGWLDWSGTLQQQAAQIKITLWKRGKHTHKSRPFWAQNAKGRGPAGPWIN